MKNILLLNGSVRKNGTSQSMLDYMQEQMNTKGQEISTIALIDVFDEKVSMEALLSKIEQAETIGIIACCYVNTLAYTTIECLERLAKVGKEELKGKNLFAIGHGGMPYLDVHEPCISVCQCFAEQMQMNWIGSAIRGVTPLINGKKLEKDVFLAKGIMKGLDFLLEDIQNNRSISSKVQKSFNICIPKVINHPFVALLNYVGDKDRKASGITNFDRQAYKENGLL